jgi:hypothetical protein
MSTAMSANTNVTPVTTTDTIAANSIQHLERNTDAELTTVRTLGR